MKKKLLPILLILLFAYPGYTQFTDNAPCTNGNPPGGSFMNWTAQSFTIHTNSLGTTTIPSPFYLPSLNNPNVNEFSRYTNRDFSNADGWELWKYDFGTPTARTDVPYFILYNRTTGLLRVFIAFANLLGQNNALSIQLKYKDNSYRSAVLENYNTNEPVRHATDNFYNAVKPILTSNYYINNTLIWYHSDYYLHFDPCICNFKSSLVLEVKLSNDGKLTFQADGKLVQNIDDNGRVGEKGIFSNIMDKNAYKSIPFFRDMYAGAEFGKSIVNSKWLSLKDNVKNDWLTFFNGWTTNIPVLGAFANLLISGLGGGGSEPVKPLVFDLNFSGTGNITYTYNYAFNELVIPGSEQTLLSTEILPYYNKPVGVFTLVKEPTLEYWERTVYADEWSPVEFHETTIESVYKLKDETIHYTVNPHAGFDLSQSEIKAQLVYENANDGSAKFEETQLFNLGCLKDIKRTFYYYKIYSPTGDPNLNYQEGWVPGRIMLKIVAKFKVAGTNIYVPYIATYDLKKVENYGLSYQNTDPSPSCNVSFPETNAATIKSVCNSSQYQNKVSQYLRISQNADNKADSALTKNAIKIYPNPMSDYLQISLPRNNTYSEIKVEIFNSIGKAVGMKKLSAPAGVVTVNNFSFLPGGLYFVRITDGKGQILQTSKIVKK